MLKEDRIAGNTDGERDSVIVERSLRERRELRPNPPILTAALTHWDLSAHYPYTYISTEEDDIIDRRSSKKLTVGSPVH